MTMNTAFLFAADDVRIFVNEVTDNRSTGYSSGCNVKLSFFGDIIESARGIKSIQLKKAIDNTGRDIKCSKDKIGYEKKRDDENKIEVPVNLKNPSRNATAIKELSGVAELYIPKRDRDSIVRIKNFMKHLGEPIVSPILKNSKIEVIIFTKEEYEEYKRKKEEEAKDKEAEQIKEGLSEAFEGFFGGFFGGSTDEKNSLVFLINDPEERFLEFSFLDSEGEQIKTEGCTWTSDYRKYNFSELPPDDAELLIYISTPKSIKKVEFKLTDITLP